MEKTPEERSSAFFVQRQLALCVAKSCPTLCDPRDCGTAGSSVLHCLHGVGSRVCPLSRWCHLILCRPLLLPSIFPSIRVFSNELTLCIRWSKYWSFSFNSSPSSEYSFKVWFPLGLTGLISLQSSRLSRVSVCKYIYSRLLSFLFSFRINSSSL